MSQKQLRTSLVRHPKTGIFQLRTMSPGETRWSQQSLKTKDENEAEQLRQDFINNHVPSKLDQIAILEAQLARMKGEHEKEEIQTALSLDNVWTSFLNSTERDPISEATLPGYESYWSGKHGLKPWMEKQGMTSLADLDRHIAGEYITYLEHGQIGRQTAGKYITFLRRLWDTLAPDTESPWKRKKARGTGGKVGKKPFSIEHQRKIIRYVEPYFDKLECRGKNYLTEEEREVGKVEYRALHIILAYTGLRLVDACMLTIEEADLKRGVIELAPKKTRYRSDDPMYAKIGIHPVLGMTLRTLLKGRSSGYFLPYIASEYDRDKSSISKRIQKQVKGATGLECSIKLPGRKRAVAVYGAHSHRKSLEDRMREGGVHQIVAMQMMGHKDNRNMTQTYSHVSDQEVIDAVTKSLPDLLKPGKAEATA